ncbi:MAG: TlpA family protein disulfide reductase [Solirubrobacteraceae bacterium]
MPAEAPVARGRSWVALRVIGSLIAAGFVALLVYGVFAQAADTTIDDALSRGEAVAAPGFALERLEGGSAGPFAGLWSRAAADGRVDLTELRGTPVVLNFWASWCVPCREEAQVLRRGWERARARGVLFLGLNQQDVREDARDFTRQFALTYPNVRDPSKATARRWGATGIPETFFLSARGEVVGHVIGTVDDRLLARGVAAARSVRPLGADRGGAQLPAR